MNLILLFEEDFTDSRHVRIQGRRLQHLQTVCQAKLGDHFTVGKVNDQQGIGLVIAINADYAELEVSLDTLPPKPLPVTLILALPRPNMLKRSLQTCASMGVKHIVLLHTQRVEKSYWQSPQLSDDNIHENLILGLEQSKDTVLPAVHKETNFNHFLKAKWAKYCGDKRLLLAHPGSEQHCPRELTEETTLFIGPEGGFIDQEYEQLTEKGCEGIHIGERILRVETAIPVLLSKLF